MAIWHFEFFIVRKNKFGFTYTSENEFDEIISWDGFDVSNDSLRRIAEILPSEKSWCKEIKQFGNSEKTNLQFYYDGNFLNEISCNIDIRNVTIEEIKSIIKFMNDNEAIIFLDKNYYVASVNNFTELIKKSQAFKFCENPRAFIEQLDKTSK